MPAHDAPGGHTCAARHRHARHTRTGYKEAMRADRRTINLLIQKRPTASFGGQPAYGFLVQTRLSVPAKDSISIPGPVLELKRGNPSAYE
jgi:hypothetical protein